MTVVIASPTWNTVADAASALAPLQDSAGGVSNVIVKLDVTNIAHRDTDPAYRLMRYAARSSGPVWYDARTGQRLYNVAGWQMTQ